MAKAGRGDDQYMLRFPPGLRDEVKKAAEMRTISMNSEIIDRIENYPKLEWLPHEIADLKSERQALREKVGSLKDQLREQKSQNARLQQQVDELLDADAKNEEKLKMLALIDELTKQRNHHRDRARQLQESENQANEISRKVVRLLVETLEVKKEEVDAIRNTHKAVE